MAVNEICISSISKADPELNKERCLNGRCRYHIVSNNNITRILISDTVNKRDMSCGYYTEEETHTRLYDDGLSFESRGDDG